jgi:hypothetical protein
MRFCNYELVSALQRRVHVIMRHAVLKLSYSTHEAKNSAVICNFVMISLYHHCAKSTCILRHIGTVSSNDVPLSLYCERMKLHQINKLFLGANCGDTNHY